MAATFKNDAESQLVFTALSESSPRWTSLWSHARRVLAGTTQQYIPYLDLPTGFCCYWSGSRANSINPGFVIMLPRMVAECGPVPVSPAENEETADKYRALSM
ncbi:hypothetical protein MN608_03418 [Microdochium nivale]|nr:hypothetical protein MN608_03418 [Microdochium nivale]